MVGVSGPWRRWLPPGTVGLVVGSALWDWPGGWSFWIDHPLVQNLVAGFALLLLAGAVVAAFLRRRGARRWVGVGRAAAIEFAVFFEINRWVMP